VSPRTQIPKTVGGLLYGGSGGDGDRAPSSGVWAQQQADGDQGAAAVMAAITSASWSAGLAIAL
jgi:hypothetical protein